MAREPFQYAVVRIVPRVEREEFVNAGVILFCRTLRFLEALVHLDEARLRALAPDVELAGMAEHLRAITRIAEGDAGAGPVAGFPQSERFGWLVAPSSTMIQTSPTHTGLCEDPRECLERLFATLVLAPER